MTTSIIRKEPYHDPAVEDMIVNIHRRLLAQSNLIARHEAERNELILEQHMHSVIVDPIWREITNCRIQAEQKILGKSQMFHAQDQTEAALKTSGTLNTELQASEREIVTLTARNKELHLNLSRYSFGKKFRVFTLFAGAADAILTYSSLHHALSATVSAILGIATGAMVSLLPIPLAYWIMKGETYRQKTMRFLSVIISMGILFYAIAFFRVSIINTIVSISLSGGHGTQSVSAWLLCVISLVLFIGVLGGTLFLWGSPEERNNAEEYAKNIAKIEQLTLRIEAINKQLSEIAHTTIQRRESARAAIEYQYTVMKRLIAIGNLALATFKSSYSSFRGQTPAHFQHDIDVKFEDHSPFTQNNVTP